MANFNSVILLGNLTRDPDLKKTPTGESVVNCSIAVNRKWTAQDGSKKEEVCYVTFEAWSKLGAGIQKYCRKGSRILLSGHLKWQAWDDSGTSRQRLWLVAEDCQFLDNKSAV